MTEAIMEAGSWIYKMLFTLVIVMIAVAIVGLAIRYSINTIDVQRDVMLDRILYDPHGFWAKDAQGMMQPGVVDKALFTQGQMDTTFVYPDNYGGAKITLIDGTAETDVMINSKTFQALAFSYSTHLQNGGLMTIRTYPVSIKDQTQQRNGFLIVEILVPSQA